MTNKDNLQQELKEKIKEGIKPSALKKLRKSKSANDLAPSSTSSLPLQKSKSQLDIPIIQQPSSEQQIQQLQAAVKFQAQTSQNYLTSLQLSQVKITDLEAELTQEKQAKQDLADQILQLRLDKIKDFGDYLAKKEELTQELELNITAGISEINRLENKLLTTNKKKLELQQKLGTSASKVAQLERKLLNNQPTNSFNYWPLLIVLVLSVLVLWLLNSQPYG